MNRNLKKAVVAPIVAALFLAATASTANADPVWQTELIHQSSGSLSLEDISAGTLVLLESSEMGIWNVRLNDGLTVTPVTDDEHFNSEARMDDGELFWLVSRDDGSETVQHLDGGTSVALEYEGNSRWAEIWALATDGNQAAWIAKRTQSGASEVYFFDGETVRALTDGGYNSYDVDVEGGRVVWSTSLELDSVIHLWDGVETRALTPPGEIHTGPAIDGDLIVWTGREASHYCDQVFLHDGAGYGAITAYAPSTPTGTYCHNAEGANVSDGVIAWLVQDTAGTGQLWVRDGGEPQMLSPAHSPLGPPKMSDGNIVWADSYDIYAYFQDTVVQVTNDSATQASPVIDGNQVAWESEGDTAYRATFHVDRGDVNMDGVVNIVDALAIAKYSVGDDPGPFLSTVADVTCDGQVTIVDGLATAQLYVGLISEFCSE